ncbi:acetamidase/formamidase family protein [Bacillus sp. REN10]|uniref:acetamidase/formamidase family protein n=1 Tax=Bacillus sp. REN10 TaxID=2782541 RepID=UPI00193C809E|nr:acetamidase/formamidase family protein [Bacillus sp. REN10]
MYHVSNEKKIYAMSPVNQPALVVNPGTLVTLDTNDCFDNQIDAEDILLSEVDWNRLNPATGPVYVEGAEPGDILSVHIQKIELADHGFSFAAPDLGVMGDRLTTNTIKKLPIHNGKVLYNDRLQIPLNPMIGVIGTAPANESVLNDTPGEHGGNMDCKQIKEGAIVFLPVNVPGALLALGDLHAAMGDGEISSGVEIAGKVTLKIEVIKDKDWKLPLVITEEKMMTVASAKTLDEATDRAVKNMVDWLEKETGMSTVEASMLLSIASDLRVCQAVNPLKTMRVELPSWMVEKYGVTLTKQMASYCEIESTSFTKY